MRPNLRFEPTGLSSVGLRLKRQSLAACPAAIVILGKKEATDVNESFPYRRDGMYRHYCSFFDHSVSSSHNCSVVSLFCVDDLRGYEGHQ